MKTLIITLVFLIFFVVFFLFRISQMDKKIKQQKSYIEQLESDRARLEGMLLLSEENWTPAFLRLNQPEVEGGGVIKVCHTCGIGKETFEPRDYRIQP